MSNANYDYLSFVSWSFRPGIDNMPPSRGSGIQQLPSVAVDHAAWGLWELESTAPRQAYWLPLFLAALLLLMQNHQYTWNFCIAIFVLLSKLWRIAMWNCNLIVHHQSTTT